MSNSPKTPDDRGKNADSPWQMPLSGWNFGIIAAARWATATSE